MINYRLQQFLNTENIVNQEQAGFGQFRSSDQATYRSKVIEDAFQA